MDGLPVGSSASDNVAPTSSPLRSMVRVADQAPCVERVA